MTQSRQRVIISGGYMRPSTSRHQRMLSVRTMTAILRRPAAACAVALRAPYSTATDEFGPMPKAKSFSGARAAPPAWTFATCATPPPRSCTPAVVAQVSHRCSKRLTLCYFVCILCILREQAGALAFSALQAVVGDLRSSARNGGLQQFTQKLPLSDPSALSIAASDLRNSSPQFAPT